MDSERIAKVALINNKELEKERICSVADFWEKIAIDGGDRAGEYYMICLLHVDATNRMYLHEVRTIKTVTRVQRLGPQLEKPTCDTQRELSV